MCIDKQTKIGVCGVHGAGKTTKVHELRDQCIDAGKSVYVVEEIARSCPIRLGTIEAQEWIWEHQLAAEKHAMSLGVDVVICDRTVMDNLMYYLDLIAMLIGNTENWSDIMNRWEYLYNEAIQWMPTYDRVIRMPMNLEWLQADDPIRPKDEDYARWIDLLFHIYVQKYVTE